MFVCAAEWVRRPGLRTMGLFAATGPANRLTRPIYFRIKAS